MNLTLDINDKKDIVLWYRTGKYSQRQLAHIFGTSRSTVHETLKKYKNVSNEELLGK